MKKPGLTRFFPFGGRLLTIAIIIPVRPGLQPQALDALAAVDCPPDQLEILVVEGTNPSRQRNEAVQQAQSEIVYFLDDDSLPVADLVARLERHFADERVVAVGGPSLTPPQDSVLQQAFGCALATPLGAGGVCNRYRSSGTVRQTTERELILCNLAFRRDAFLAAGGLDERLYPNEENELLDRLQRQGKILLHDPQLVVVRSQRPSLAAFAYQMFRYGRGRAQQTRLAGMSGLMPLVPLFFVLYLLALPLLRSSLLFLPLFLYLLLVCLCSLHAASRCRTAVFAALLVLVFPVLHLANGLGLLVGFIQPGGHTRRSVPALVNVKRLRLTAPAMAPGVS